jgi:hypothetical protein
MHTILEFPGNVSHPPTRSAASRKATAPEPEPRSGPRTINGRPIKFSTETEAKRARKAEETTGLVAREVFRPARKRSGVPELFPDDPQMRCQLGEVINEFRHQRAVPKMRDEFLGQVDVFALKAYGRTWPQAAAMAVRLGYTATEDRP